MIEVTFFPAENFQYTAYDFEHLMVPLKLAVILVMETKVYVTNMLGKVILLVLIGPGNKVRTTCLL